MLPILAGATEKTNRKFTSCYNNKILCDYEKNTYYFVSVTCDRSVVFSGYSGFLHQ